MLPTKKVIDELSHLRVREDQTAEPIMVQVETPFLKMMVEESAKFGTKLAPFTTTELPPLPEPVPSASAAAESAPVAAIRPPPPSWPAQPAPVAPATSRTIPQPRVQTEPTPDGAMARITSVTPCAPAENKLEKSLPIGTGGPAFPRVPASSGPPVPPAAPPAAAPTRIPFQMPPSAVPAKIATQTPAPAPPPTVAPVQLSLPAVLANLPGDSLRMREDQEVTTQDETFETPFSAKAKEDAERFAQGRKTALPSAAASSKPEVPKAETPKIELPKAAEAEVPKVKAPDLQIPKVAAPRIEAAKVELSAPVDAFRVAMGPAAKLETARPAEGAPKFDAKAAIALACALPGVASCSVIFADGLIIAGNIPDEMHMEGLSAVAPTMLQKLQKHMCETQLGPLRYMTVHGEKSPVTFFEAGDLYLN